MCMGPGSPCFADLVRWLGDRGHKIKSENVANWYTANRDRFDMVSPRYALWRTLTAAEARRERMGKFLDANWERVEASLQEAIATSGGAVKVLELMATLDLGVRVAADQMHSLEVRLDQQKVVQATIAQVFGYLRLELKAQGLDALRVEALEAIEGAIADRIAGENQFLPDSRLPPSHKLPPNTKG